MNHASARVAITSILGGTGFADRALALTFAAMVADHPLSGDALAARALARSAAMAPDEAPAYSGPLLAAPVPSDEAGLCAQLAPVVAEHPAQTGLQVAALNALCALWPHVASSERPLLRLRFLSGLAARRAPAGSTAGVVQLRAWQRDLPTAYAGAPPSVSTLKALLAEREPHLAYRVVAEHLGSDMDLPRLNSVLGALAGQVLLHFRDQAGCTLQVLMGAVAGEQLCRWTPPEHLATLAAQQAHQLWWCRQRAGLAPVRSCLDVAPMPFAKAVHSGDITAAQRAARSASNDQARFWQAAWTLLDEWRDLDDHHWLRALSLVTAIAWRTGYNAISPDDAAALGAVFADMAYERPRVTS